jgi:hypothetical protein
MRNPRSKHPVAVDDRGGLVGTFGCLYDEAAASLLQE